MVYPTQVWTLRTKVGMYGTQSQYSQESDDFWWFLTLILTQLGDPMPQLPSPGQEEVMQRIADGAGPSLEGTKAEAVAWAMWGHWMPLRGLKKTCGL